MSAYFIFVGLPQTKQNKDEQTKQQRVKANRRSWVPLKILVAYEIPILSGVKRVDVASGLHRACPTWGHQAH